MGYNMFSLNSCNFHITVKSCKFKVLGSRGFISKYQKFELYRGLDIKIYNPHKGYYFLPIKHKFWAR